MPPFVFPFDRALQWYRTQCAIEEERLAGFLANWNKAGEEARRVEAESALVEQETASLQTLAAQDLHSLVFYRAGVQKRSAELRAEQQRLVPKINAQRGKVHAIRRKLRLFEKMRERRLAEHTLAEERELQNTAMQAYLARWRTEFAQEEHRAVIVSNSGRRGNSAAGERDATR
jgi:hypothetical protein